MTEDEFPVVVTGIVANNGDVLIGQKEEVEGHPISDQWHFPGGHLDQDEDVKGAVRREIEEETGLEVKVHQLVDVYRGEVGIVRVLFHCESEDRSVTPKDDLQDVKWVEPEALSENLGDYDSSILEEREEIQNFIEKLKKMPVV